MASEVSAEVNKDILDLETRLAVLRDRSRLHRADASEVSWGLAEQAGQLIGGPSSTPA